MRIAPLSAGVLLAALVTSCGYSVGYESAYGSRRAVGIVVAGNATFRQRLEIGLTREIERELATHSNWYPTAPNAADVLLRVQLVEVEGRRLVGAGGGRPMREGALDFAAEVRLVDTLDGTVLRQTRVVDRGEFRLAVDETESSASTEALSDLARKIVLALEGDI